MAFQLYQPTAAAAPARRSLGRFSGRNKRALCIGIDNYPEERDRLSGCVNDARQWRNALVELGFHVDVLTDSEATRQGILDAMDELIGGSRAGDVIVIHLSCHGTQLEDFNRDDDDSLDEAVVPYDHRIAGYLIDDDLADIVDGIPDGVNVTFFMDLCHSGSATRFAVGPLDVHSNDAKVRYLAADEEMQAIHCQIAKRRHARGRDPYKNRPEVLFAACAPHQTAKEREGQGDFTRYALQVLRDGGERLTNAAFIAKVNEIGRFESQDPALWSDVALQQQLLLGRRGGNTASNDESVQAADRDSLAAAIRDIENALQRLRNMI